jgi:hypothetical protein
LIIYALSKSLFSRMAHSNRVVPNTRNLYIIRNIYVSASNNNNDPETIVRSSVIQAPSNSNTPIVSATQRWWCPTINPFAIKVSILKNGQFEQLDYGEQFETMVVGKNRCFRYTVSPRNTESSFCHPNTTQSFTISRCFETSSVGQSPVNNWNLSIHK